METIATATEPGIYSGVCPARDLLDRIADKWTALIIGTHSTRREPVRFGELRRAVHGISQKMLTQTLRELERDGLVVRKIYAQIPPRVEYALTPLGHTLARAARRCLASGSSATWRRCAVHRKRSTGVSAERGLAKAPSAAP